MTEDKEFSLKLLQAWVELKFKISGFLLIANGAALATAVAFLKDKGPEIEGVYALNSSA